jgi:capsular polysaccharide biosynthesis protein
MATGVLGSLHLDRPPYSLTPETFRAKHVEIEPLHGSRMIRVKVTLPDPVMAARGANEVAGQTVELARTLNQQDTAFLRDYLGAQLEASQSRKEQLQREMVEYRAHSQLELVETDADSLLEQRSQLSKLVIDIAAEEARLATAERELATQERILKVPRYAAIEGALARLPLREGEERPSATTTPQSAGPPRVQTPQMPVPTPQIPAAQTESPKTGGRQTNTPEADRVQTIPPAQLPAPQMGPPQTAVQRYEQSDEKQIRRPARASDQSTSPDATPSIPPEAIGNFVNPVYEILDYQASVARTRLAALRRQRDELIQVRRVNAQQLQTLSTMYRTQIELRKLQTDYDLAEKIYLDLSMKHEQARVQAVSRSAHVQVLDPAVQPVEPVAPRKRRIVAAGAVSGLLLALGAVIVIAALRSRSRTVS